MIKRGMGLVLTGTENTAKARLLAARQGRYVEIKSIELESYFKPWLTAKVRTVIVHGWAPLSMRAAEELKRMIASDTIAVERQHEPAETLRTPNFIFCVARQDAFRFAGDRRYHVVDIGDTK